jgi:hypothetical protein
VSSERLLGQVRQQDRLAGAHRRSGEALAGPRRPLREQRGKLMAVPAVTLAHRYRAQQIGALFKLVHGTPVAQVLHAPLRQGPECRPDVYGCHQGVGGRDDEPEIALSPPLLGDVTGDDGGAENHAVEVADGTGYRLDPARPAELWLQDALGTPDPALAQGLEQTEIVTAERGTVRPDHAGGEHGGDRAKDLGLLTETEQRQRRPVRLDDHRRGVEDQQPIAERLENRLELGGLPPNERLCWLLIYDRAMTTTLPRWRHSGSVGETERRPLYGRKMRSGVWSAVGTRQVYTIVRLA